jgi:hypothetical protein
MEEEVVNYTIVENKELGIIGNGSDLYMDDKEWSRDCGCYFLKIDVRNSK